MTNNKQQTAVEWQYIELSKFLNGKSEFTHKSDILIKAKEMEKEQKNNMPIHIEEGVYNTHVYIENGVIHVKANKETYRNNHAVMIGGNDYEP